MRSSIAAALAVLIIAGIAFGAEPGMEIYFVDVEGGAATLVIGPTRKSVLVDCGNPGARDSERIARVVKTAGLDRIDTLVTTHWHSDHYGGVGSLSALIPIGEFRDRGIPERLKEDPQYFPFLIGNYKKAASEKRKEIVPGDKIELGATEAGVALSAVCLTSARRLIPAADGAPKNACCGDERKSKPIDESDNAMSVSLLFRFGDFTFLDCGDLTWNVEYDLVCPHDRVGRVEVFQVTHHGLDSSNNPVLIDTIKPRVAIFNNGPRKGGMPDVTRALRKVSDLQAIFQVHRNLGVGDDLNAEASHVANVEETRECKGEFIGLAVAADSKSYTVQIGSAGPKRSFETHKRP